METVTTDSTTSTTDPARHAAFNTEINFTPYTEGSVLRASDTGMENDISLNGRAYDLRRGPITTGKLAYIAASGYQLASKNALDQQAIVDVFCEVFWREAQRRNWCSDAAKLMTEIANKIAGKGISVDVNVGTRPWAVTWTETWTITRTETIEAASEEEAIREADQCYVGQTSFGDLVSYHPHHCWEYED